MEQTSIARAFRLCVAGSWSCYVLYFFYPLAYPYLYDDSTRGLLTAAGYKAVFPFLLHEIVSWAYLLIWSALAWGMWRYSAVARSCYLGMVILATVFTLLEGFRVLAPVETLLFDVAIMLDGALLALAYFSPIKNNFHKDAVTA